jgi:hypothetical protein
MPRKRRSRKRRGSRSIKSKPGAEHRTDDRSFGSVLDEVGFRPLGRRILVSKRRLQSARAKAALGGEEASPTADRPLPSIDDPLSYDTRDPSWVRKAIEDALAGADKAVIEKEVDSALRRWGLRQ